MRILFVGDVVGRSGRTVVYERLPGLVEKWQLDLVVVNGENAAGGFGITEAIYRELIEAGADAITLGNHAWDQKEALVFIERAPKLIRPINYPAGTPGRGAAMIEAKNGARVLVVNAMGRIFMDPLDDPFAAVDRELMACPLGKAADAIIVDIHAEATSEKQALGFFCDGRSSLVVGTHTHTPTADLRVLAGGTAFMSDVGMTGDYDSVIGMGKDEPMQRFLQRISSARFEPATGAATLCAVAVETDPATGLATRVERGAARRLPGTGQPRFLVLSFRRGPLYLLCHDSTVLFQNLCGSGFRSAAAVRRCRDHADRHPPDHERGAAVGVQAGSCATDTDFDRHRPAGRRRCPDRGDLRRASRPLLRQCHLSRLFDVGAARRPAPGL